MNKIIAVQDSKGNIYTMPSDSPKCILSVHYSTSYFQFVVQDYYVDDDGNEIFPEKDIIVPLNEKNWVDFIAVQGEEFGKIVNVDGGDLG